MRLTPWAGFVIGALLAGCSGSTPPSEAQCTRDVVDRCEVVGVVFAPPQALDATHDLAARAHGITLALFRSDHVCVTYPGSEPRREVASRFAVVDPVVLLERSLGAVDFSEPHTGFFISEVRVDTMEEEWTAAQRPGVRFDAAVLYLPTDARPALGDSVRWVGDIRWSLSSTNDSRRYAGEIIIWDDSFDPVPAMPVRNPPQCR